MKTFETVLIFLIICAITGCTNTESVVADLQANSRPTPFLMFQDGNAEQAMEFYVAIFPGSEVISMKRHLSGGPAPEGQIELATFELMGQRIHCTDSPPIHDFDFTPSTSLYIECTDEQQLDRFAKQLSDGGEFLMPPGDYGFSRKFAFLKDQFGVAWQVNLPNAEADSK